MAVLPAVVRQQRRSGLQITEGRDVGGRRLRTPARNQVEFGQLLALFLRGHQDRTAIELADDVEDDLLPPVGRRVRGEQSADSQVRLGSPFPGNQRVSSLVYAVMHESIRALETVDQIEAHGLPEAGVQRLLRRVVEDG